MNSLGRFEHGGDDIVLDVPSVQPVYFTEADVNELAQAKGANVAGLGPFAATRTRPGGISGIVP